MAGQACAVRCEPAFQSLAGSTIHDWYELGRRRGNIPMEHISEIVAGNVSRRSISDAPARPFLQQNKNGPLALLPESGAGKNLQNVDRKTQTRVKAIVHVIPAAVVYDVYIVVIAPTHWPRRAESEVVAAVCETVTIVVPAVHMEAVPAAETGILVGFRNSAVRAIVAAAVLRRGV
jgi:hypothetical protein